MRDQIGCALLQLAGSGLKFFVVDADNGRATRVNAFGETYPSWYVNVGCAEQNLVGVSAGLSLTGVPVVAATFSVFLLGRAYDQIRNSISASNLRVVLLGTHAGLSTGADGGTHCCPEDLALMRALPRVQVLVPAHYEDLTPMLKFALESPGPSYIRVPREELWEDRSEPAPIITFSSVGLRCWRTGTELAFVCAGLLLPRVLAVADALINDGWSIAVFDLPLLNIDANLVLTKLSAFRAVITVEDHWPAGGISEMIAAILSGVGDLPVHGINAAHRHPSSGPLNEVLDDMGLSIQRIMSIAEDTLRQPDLT